VDVPPKSKQYVSRAAIKLEHALDEFGVDVTGYTCADFGCNVGGLTDVLLQRGAAKVYAIDTGYGVLAYKLRTDPRVAVMERTNALYVTPPQRVDLVTIDLAWTPQHVAIPAAMGWLRVPPPSGGGGVGGRIITLVKPHYELSEDEKRSLLRAGRLDHAEAERVFRRILDAMPGWGAKQIAHARSPITGGKSSGRKPGSGNAEFLVLLEPLGT
jgi:23S rRNA (cytidine1920-2'-O)/16S rRNA (cytidine1409-2'-O)-methyltransferase